jgi:DNA-binding transcriptional ArsR family regulator
LERIRDVGFDAKLAQGAGVAKVLRQKGVKKDLPDMSDVLTAISHPTRRAIIGQLSSGPARFLEIAKLFDTALNSVTGHLRMLERAGLIERRKQGREVFISFRGEPLQEVAG